MEEWHKKCNEIDGMLDMSEMLEGIEGGIDSAAPARESVMGAQTTQAGIQTQDLQTVINGWADALNRSAIAKSTGLPVRTPIAQYKGFAAEEYFKLTTKINALAKGIPNYKIGVYTNGQLPDGSTLSGIDMHSDILVYSRKWPWSKAEKIADVQSKMHSGKKAAEAYAHDMAKEQYAEQEFVGGAGQGINDKLHAKVGNTEITSDNITPEAAEKLAADMEAQNVGEYERAAEKYKQLDAVNLGRAVVAGTISGAVFSTVGEICYVIKNKDSLSEDQFIQSVQHILCGSIDGGVRGGAVMSSVQLVGKAIGKEVPSNTLGAVPIMAAANVSVDFAKDLYRCFVTKTIDPDDLLCNTINNSFSSVAGFGGAWIGGQIAGQVAGTAMSVKIAAATGASIGSAFGPIGTIIGSAVGGLIIGLGANAVIKTGNADAEDAFNKILADINAQIELEGYERLYYFADSMSEISGFRLSFKDLLPCYNLISDLKEYNLHKKAIRHIQEQLKRADYTGLEQAKRKALVKMESDHQQRLVELQIWLNEQKAILQGEYRDTVKTYITNSFVEYEKAYDVLVGDMEAILTDLHNSIVLHNSLLNYSRNWVAINGELNIILAELMSDEADADIMRPFVDKLMWYMQQDELLIGRQYISYEEAYYMVNGVG